MLARSRKVLGKCRDILYEPSLTHHMTLNFYITVQLLKFGNKPLIYALSYLVL